MKWSDIGRPKEQGGLNIGRLKERNIALLGKWLWQFANEQGSLWQSTILSKYGAAVNSLDINQVLPLSCSFMWKHIVQISHLFFPHTRFLVGHGRNIRFWKDLWMRDLTLEVCFPRLFCSSTQNIASIAEILS